MELWPSFYSVASQSLGSNSKADLLRLLVGTLPGSLLVKGSSQSPPCFPNSRQTRSLRLAGLGEFLGGCCPPSPSPCLAPEASLEQNRMHSG